VRVERRVVHAADHPLRGAANVVPLLRGDNDRPIASTTLSSPRRVERPPATAINVTARHM
jgi:hypothetical protein